MKLSRVLTPVVLALVASSVAQAAPTVAKLKNVKGTVLVTQGDAMVAATAGQAVPAGARIVTTAGSVVTVSMDKGCEVTLRENQRLSVRDYGNCAQLTAAIEGTGIVPSSALGRMAAGGDLVAQTDTIGGPSGPPPGLYIAGAMFAGTFGYAMYQSRRSSSGVSPF